MDIPALDARMRGWLLNDYRAIVAERGKQFVGYVLARRDAVELIIWRSIGFVDYAVALERAANASAAHVPPSSAP